MNTVFEIAESDLFNGLVYAAQSLNFTYNRMNYGNDDPDAELKRFRRIRNGIVIEQACERILSGEFKIPLISSPFRTDYRTTDSSELIAVSAQGAMLPADVKGFHIYREYNGEERTPEMLFERGYALVPQDQYSRHAKPLYIFPFLIADDFQTPFYFNNTIEFKNDFRMPESSKIPQYEQPVSVGVSFAKNFGQVASRIFRIVNPAEIRIPDVETVDCVFGFDEKIRAYNLYIRAADNKAFFIDKNYWRDALLGVTNASLVMAGWATAEDVGDWKRIETGTTGIFPYYKTRNHNYGCQLDNLRSIETLKEYLSNLEK